MEKDEIKTITFKLRLIDHQRLAADKERLGFNHWEKYILYLEDVVNNVK